MLGNPLLNNTTGLGGAREYFQRLLSYKGVGVHLNLDNLLPDLILYSLKTIPVFLHSAWAHLGCFLQVNVPLSSLAQDCQGVMVCIQDRKEPHYGTLKNPMRELLKVSFSPSTSFPLPQLHSISSNNIHFTTCTFLGIFGFIGNSSPCLWEIHFQEVTITKESQNLNTKSITAEIL